MKRKKPYYVVIDLFEPKKTTIQSSIQSISTIIGVHRNTIKVDNDTVYGHFLVLPRKIE